MLAGVKDLYIHIDINFNKIINENQIGTTSSGGSTSNILLNARITVYGPSQCSTVSGVKFWNGQICAGEYAGEKDTCQGDSGK